MTRERELRGKALFVSFVGDTFRSPPDGACGLRSVGLAHVGRLLTACWLADTRLGQIASRHVRTSKELVMASSWMRDYRALPVHEFVFVSAHDACGTCTPERACALPCDTTLCLHKDYVNAQWLVEVYLG